jgi:branched-chain amino acid aminotransferase
MYFFFNNKLYTNEQNVISNESKAFRYGVSVFETMKWANGQIVFFDQHVERLFAAANALQITIPKLFTAPIILIHIKKLVEKNSLDTARVRLTIFNGNGGLFDPNDDTFNVLIETYTLSQTEYKLNENGLDLCIYDEIYKPINFLSAYKTGNHLLYVFAAQYAKSQKCNEAIICNQNQQICETTISNLYILKDNQIITPPVTDGCINGVLRNKLLELNPNIQEQNITKEMVLAADAVFISNTIKGIQWVKKVEHISYSFDKVATVANKLISSINEEIG